MLFFLLVLTTHTALAGTGHSKSNYPIAFNYSGSKEFLEL